MLTLDRSVRETGLPVLLPAEASSRRLSLAPAVRGMGGLPLSAPRARRSLCPGTRRAPGADAGMPLSKRGSLP
jgi:hypothetical protein